jgi:hypothetical protein
MVALFILAKWQFAIWQRKNKLQIAQVAAKFQRTE